MVNQLKVCSKCKRELPVENFAKRPKTRDGLQYYCRECDSAAHKKWFRSNKSKEKYLKYQAEKQTAWAEANKIKTAAHRAAKAISLVGKKCERCGEKQKLHRHHRDYNKPLEVVILCQPCHEKEHHS